jgi:predicted nuclease of predicted toxin-antitoxin system
MKFKIDENLPLGVKEEIRQAGYECFSVYEQNLNGKPDTEVLNKVREENLILITLDFDFADIRFNPPQESSGCIVLKPKSQSIGSILYLMEKVLEELEKEKINRTLWIVTEKKLRIRE